MMRERRLQLSQYIWILFLLLSRAEAFATDSKGKGKIVPDGTTHFVTSLADTPQTRTGDDLFTQTTAENNSQRQRRPKTAPPVDSTLLRFISRQKKEHEASMSSVRNLQLSNPDIRTSPSSRYLASLDGVGRQTVVGRDDPAMNKLATKLVEALQEDIGENPVSEIGIKGNAEEIQTTETTTATTALERTKTSVDFSDAVDDTWLGQYNANRVAQLLMEHGVWENTARQAGAAVQSHVLARTARRRVRDFLKRRDLQWATQTSGIPIVVTAGNATDTPSTMTRATNSTISDVPEYGLDDVMEVLFRFGLKAVDVAHVFIHTPSVALMMPQRIQAGEGEPDGDEQDDGSSSVTSGYDGETVEETLRRVMYGVLGNMLGLRKADARRIVRRCHGLLTMRGSRRAEEIIMLMMKLGVSERRLVKDSFALSTLLQRSPSALFRLVSFLASDAVRMPVQEIGPLLRRKETDMLINAVSPKLNSPKQEQLDGRSDDQYRAQIAQGTDPTVAKALWGRDSELRREKVDKVYRRMTKTAWTLRNRIGTEDLSKVISIYPNVLLLNVEEQILPNARYLQELGIWENDLAGLLQRYPVLLGLRLSQMKNVVKFWQSIDISDESITRIVRGFPVLLTMDVRSQMIPVVEFLAEIGIRNVGRFVTRMPPVLGYSIEKELRPKWEFLCRVNMYPVFELSTFPTYFSHPFDAIIKARYEYLIAVKGIPTQLLSPSSVLMCSNSEFAETIANDDDGGDRYKGFQKARRLRSASQGLEKVPPKRKYKVTARSEAFRKRQEMKRRERAEW